MEIARFRYLGPRLAGMMFLQYFGLGAWIVSLARYIQAPVAQQGLGYSPTETGILYSTLPIAGMIAPLAVGPLADRFFSAEKLLAVFQFIMAIFLALAGWICSHPGDQQTKLFACMIVYALFCLPTLTLTNVIALRNLQKPSEQFGRVRLIGTFGWVVSGVIVSVVLNPVSPAPLFLAAGTSLVQAAYSFTLPNTPPMGHGRSVKEILGIPAIRLFARPAFLAFAIAAVLGNMMNQFYTLFAAKNVADHGVAYPEAFMTIGQWVEMACMAILPFLIRKCGLKTVMTIGLLGWVLRNTVLACGSIETIIAVALPMHGLSYTFFTISGTLFVDRKAPAEMRTGAQSMVTFLSSGPAVLAGYGLAGVTAGAFPGDWTHVWMVPAIGCTIATCIFFILFREPKEMTIPPGKV